ncbi:MAG: discoidin domain-containing protein [Bacteroidales bacterium]
MNFIKQNILLLAVIMLLISCSDQSTVNEMSLDSANPDIVWEVKPQADIQSSGMELSKAGNHIRDFVKGLVPGTVFTSYIDAGKEKDPNYAKNIWEVDETFYNRPFWYRTEFNLSDNYKEGQRVWLHFDNTNRFADFYFNGTKLSGTEGSTKDVSGHMMRTKYDITDLIDKAGKNAIAVLITDADEKKTRDAKDAYGVICSPSYLAGAGWDWMPYVPGRLAGITGDVYLKFTGDVRMQDPWVRSKLPTNEKAEISIKSDLINNTSKDKEVELIGTINPGAIKFSKSITVKANSIATIFINKDDISELIIENPKLWWPNGYGDPNLYTCNLECKIDGNVSDQKEITFGIKRYEYKMVTNKADMPVMTFFINGQKIYLKGGNWGMSEYLLRCRGEEYERKIVLHKEMNYNMIRLWTGCVTDDDFYKYCDKHGILVWDDFWLYVAYNDVAQPEAFKANARDKVRRLRNHPSIALWCGANETHPKKELDDYLRAMVAEEDGNERMYKSCSNQDGLSGSGWWGNQPPKHHFETSGSNLAFNDPPYPYSSEYGYGLRSEIGTATFPVYESVIEFIPKEDQWPLPTDEQLKTDDDNVWNKHFFGKEASNANPINYKKAVNIQFGESNSLEEFCEKAQFINIEVMRGMYEAWNDKLWDDATGMLIWMSQSAYPSFVWQTYDYYYDASGSYWGAKYACEPLHIQWNSLSNSIKVINTTSNDLKDATAKATIYNLVGEEMPQYYKETKIDVEASNRSEAFVLNFNPYNLANGKTVKASSEVKDAALVVDGGAGSRWISEADDNQWIYVDLGKEEQIETVVIKWETAAAQAYEIQTSNNAKDWQTVYQTKQGKGDSEEVSFTKQKARYVRINCTKRKTQYAYSIYEIEIYGSKRRDKEMTPMNFVKLELVDNTGKTISENFYWRNGEKDLDYTALNSLPKADISCEITSQKSSKDSTTIIVDIKNNSSTVAFGNRLRLVNKSTGKRVLPLIMPENYITLMPGESKTVPISASSELMSGNVELLLKQYGYNEEVKQKLTNS